MNVNDDIRKLEEDAEKTEIISLVDNNLSDSDYIPNIRDSGAYMVLVESVDTSGTCAVFAICKGSHQICGSITRIVNSPGEKGEELTISWDREYPELKWLRLGTNQNCLNIYFRVKVIKCFREIH